jgi:hypothetical protein
MEIPHGPEKGPVSCLTDWHYSICWPFLFKIFDAYQETVLPYQMTPFRSDFR